MNIPTVNGQVANRVFYSRDGRPHGEFRKTGQTAWVEFSKDRNWEALARFTETARDEWSVYLYDSSRKVRIQLDLWRKKVIYSDSNSSNVDLYDTKGATAVSEDADVTPPLSGQSVNKVDLGTLTGGQPQGQLRQTGAFTWVQTDTGNQIKHYFTETKRHNGTVFLYDSSRYVTYEVHVTANKVIYTDDAGSRREEFAILKADSRINGKVVNRVSYRTSAKIPAGEFRQTGETTWVELDEQQRVRSRWQEEAFPNNRDDWSVYLRSIGNPGPGLSSSIYIDLWTKSIKDRSNHKELYLVERASANPADVSVISYASVTNSKETTANTVYVGDFNGKSLGTYRQTGEKTWVAVGADHKVKFTLNKTKRDHDSIYLHEPSSNASIQINLDSHRIIDPVKTFGSATPGISATPRGTSPVGYWAFDEGNGTTAADGSGNGLNATLHSDRIWNTNITLGGHDLSLNGVDDYASILNHTSFNFSTNQDFTVALWVKPDAIQADTENGDNDIVEKWSGSGGYPFVIRYLNQTSANNGKVIVARYDGSNNPGILSKATINDGKYHHIAFVKHGGTLYLYIDGKLDGTARDTTTGNTTNNSSLFLGRRGGNAPYDNYFKGNLDTLRIYNQALTLDEINTFAHGYTVLRATSAMNGWLVSKVTYSAFGSSTQLGEFRQTAEKNWVEMDKNEQVIAYFNEVRREDWSIFLNDPSRNYALELDLRAQRILLGRNNSNPGEDLYKILSESVELDVWLRSEEITSRSALTEDFDHADLKAKNLNPKPVYRTSIKVSNATSWVDVWASEQVTVEIDEQNHTIDSVKPVRVKPSAFSTISVSIPATDVNCPTLILRTDLMSPEHKHYIFPDVEAHKKIVAMKDGDLYNARAELGINPNYTQEQVGQVQKAMQNLAKTVQHTYNKTPHGVHHDRALHPQNMEHPHFLLDFAGDAPRYQQLQPSEVPQYIQNARVLQVNAAQGLFDDVGNAFKKATKVVVHTTENLGNDIVQTATNVGSDVVKTTEKVGEDIVHGDVTHVGQDLFQGGENIGKDLVKGAGQVAKDVVSGAGKLLVITLHTAEEIVQYVVSHTGVVGKALGWLFTKIGAELTKVVAWLLDKLGWTDILHTQDVLVDILNSQLDKMQTYPSKLKQESDKFFTNLSNTISKDIDRELNQFDVLKHTPNQQNQPQPVESHSPALEKIEWLLHKFHLHSANATALTAPALPASHDSLLDNLIEEMEKQFGKDGGKVLGAFEDAGGDLEAIFGDLKHAPEYLLGALLEIAKGLGIVAFDMIKTVFDLLLDLIEELLKSFKGMVNAEWNIPFISDLYETLTGKKLSFLSFSCLVLAIPTTIISKAESKTPPFKSVNVGAGLTPLSSEESGFGYTYVTLHCIKAFTEPLSDYASIVLSPEEEPLLNDEQQRKLSMVAEVGVDAPTSEGGGVKLLDVFNFIMDILAQVAGNPLPDPALAFNLVKGRDEKDYYQAPNIWSERVWLFQFGGLILGGVGLWKPSKALTLVTAIYGFVHMIGMSIVSVADTNKYEYVKKNINDPSKITVEEKASAQNYLEWQSKYEGNTWKTFGNILDTLPEIAKLGLLVKNPWTLLVACTFDFAGHYGEGLIYSDRTKDNELL